MDQRTVLVVEDDDETQNLLRALLRRHGAAVQMAEDGERAIELLRVAEFDTVILDLMLPKRNGFEVAGALFTLERRPKLIVVSSLARHFADRFPDGTVMLQKPFDIDQLDAAITNTSTPAPRFL
ncbi:MAG TPA: response regulator [Thermoanaerobaculia bacterium]|jgi:DNA-binding response OmpR family regulator